jgi:hypothetical protein
MTRLPIVEFKTMEKVLVNLGFHNTRSKGSHISIAILMAGPLRYRIILEDFFSPL